MCLSIDQVKNFLFSRVKHFAKNINMSDDCKGMSLSDAMQRLWELDANRIAPGTLYSLNVQSGKKPYWKEDKATEPLFEKFNKDELFSDDRPTFKTFHQLLDNYTSETGQAEVVTNEERRETWAFLDAIMETGPMQFCHTYCKANAKNPQDIPDDESGFKRLLHNMWFKLYHRSRGGRADSSGFEHVFIGEVKDGDVSGFHNWIQLALEEEQGELDYRGYIKPRGSSEAEADHNDHLLTLQFRWNGIEKFMTSCFIGTSPEFEVAVYTICFLCGEKENEITLRTGTDVFQVKIKCYSMARDKIGTAYPEVMYHEEE